MKSEEYLKIEEKIFNLDRDFKDIPKIGNTSLWWFYKEKVINNGFRFKKFDINKNIERIIINEKKIDFKKIIYYFLTKIALTFFIKIKIIKILLNNKKKIQKKKILFFTYTPYIKYEKNNFKIDKIQSLINEFQKEKLEYEIISTSPLTEIFKKKNDNNSVIILEEISNAKIILKSIKQTYILKKKIKTFFLNIKKKEPKIFSELKPELKLILSWQMTFLNVLYYNNFKKIIEKTNPEIVISTSGFFDEAIIAATANSNKTTIRLQHGILGQPRFQLLNKMLYFCFGKMDKELIIKYNKNNNSKNILPVGPIIFQDLLKIPKQNKDKNNILIATRPFIENQNLSKREYIKRINSIFETVKKIPCKNIIIKLHPQEKNLKLYQNIFQHEWKEKIKIYTKLDDYLLFDLINKSKFVISFGSTVDLFSIFLNRPDILIHFPEFQNLSENFQNINSIVKIKYDHNFEKNIMNVLNSKKHIELLKKNRKKDIERIFIKDYINSTHNAIQLIKNKI